jgi:hypothetical protein
MAERERERYGTSNLVGGSRANEAQILFREQQSLVVMVMAMAMVLVKVMVIVMVVVVDPVSK